jgi:hypothetical protein
VKEGKRWLSRKKLRESCQEQFTLAEDIPRKVRRKGQKGSYWGPEDHRCLISRKEGRLWKTVA